MYSSLWLLLVVTVVLNAVTALQLLDQVLDEGDDASFSCQATGEPAPSISWYFNGVLLNNETNVDKYDITEISETLVNTTTISSTLTIMSVQSSDVGTYTCNVTNAISTDTSSGVLTVNVAPTITTPVEGQQFSITEGSNGSITCTATGYPVPRVAWSTSMQRNANRLIVGDPVVSSTGVGNETSVSVELMVIGAKRVDTGLYRCSANDDVAIADVAIIIQYICESEVDMCSTKLYPYGALLDNSALPEADDPISLAIESLSNFVFCGQLIRQIYVSGNGIISFESDLVGFRPRLSALSGTPLFVAPYWADSDIRGTGEVFYHQTSDEILLAEVTSDLQSAFPEFQDLIITNLLVVTWNAIGYHHRNTDKTNTFQCVMAAGVNKSFVIFLYNDIQWTTGDSSGGKFGFGGDEALAGINGCDGVNDIIIPESMTPDIIGITGTSNVNKSGVWMFRVDQVQVNEQLFQIRLNLVEGCVQWIRDNKDIKMESIANTIAEQVERICSCNFNSSNIVDAAFSCRASTMDPDLENTVVYRAKISPQVPVLIIDARDIVKIVENWIQSAPSITVNRLILNIDPNCPITLESLDAEDCVIIATTTSSIQPTTTTSSRLPITTTLNIQPTNQGDGNSESSTGIIVGATVAAIIAIILIVIIAVLTTLYCRLKSNYRNVIQQNGYDYLDPLVIRNTENQKRWVHNEDTSPMNLPYEIPRFHGFNADNKVNTGPVRDEPNGDGAESAESGIYITVM